MWVYKYNDELLKLEFLMFRLYDLEYKIIEFLFRW